MVSYDYDDGNEDGSEHDLQDDLDDSVERESLHTPTYGSSDDGSDGSNDDSCDGPENETDTEPEAQLFSGKSDLELLVGERAVA